MHETTVERVISRAEQSEGAGPAVRLRWDDGLESRGRLLAIADRCARVAFPAAGAPSPAIGLKVQLEFSSDRSPRIIKIPGEVVSRTDRRDSRDYDFRLLTDESAAPSLVREVDRMLNRRAALRVMPGTEAPLRVLLLPTPAGEATEVEVVDISSTGLGLYASIADEARLARYSQITVCLWLPGADHALHIGATIRRRHATCGGVRYAVEFDAPRTDGPDEGKTLIARYVVQREREMLRQSRLR